MAFDDLKDRLRESLQESLGQLQDSPVFNSLKERYETLTPAAQNGVVFAIIAFVALLFLSVPLTYFDSASTALSDFEQNREMIRELLKSEREAKSTPSVPPGPPLAQLTMMVQGIVQGRGLVPEQIGTVTPLSPNPAKGLAPDLLQQEGVLVGIKSLNVRQIIDFAFEFQRLHPAVKLTGMDVQVTEKNDHYFNVSYRLVSFAPPVAKVEKEEK